MKKESTALSSRKAQKTSEQFTEEIENAIFSPTISSYLEIQKRLAEPIPLELVFEKERGGKSFPYMNITDCADLLDERAGVWQCAVISEGARGEDFILTVEISILAKEGWISRQDVGIEVLNHSSYGDTASNAYAMAFKRAAAKHGLGRELWRKHDYFASEPVEIAERRKQRQQSIAGEPSNVPANANRNQAAAGKPTNPIAASLADLLTAKQIGMIRGVARDYGKDSDSFIAFHLNAKIDELSKRAASWIIDNLPLLPDSAAGDQKPPSNVSAFPSNPNKPENFKDDAPQANAGQIKALQVTIDNCLNNAGIDESVILAEFANVGCRNTSFANNGEFMTENLTGERAAALIKKFNHFLDHGV